MVGFTALPFLALSGGDDFEASWRRHDLQSSRKTKCANHAVRGLPYALSRESAVIGPINPSRIRIPWNMLIVDVY